MTRQTHHDTPKTSGSTSQNKPTSPSSKTDSTKPDNQFMTDLLQSLKAVQILNKQLKTIHDAIIRRELRTERYYDKHDPRNTRHKKFDASQLKSSNTGGFFEFTETLDMVIPDEGMFKDLDREISHANKVMSIVKKAIADNPTFPKSIITSIEEGLAKTTENHKTRAEHAPTHSYQKHMQRGDSQTKKTNHRGPVKEILIEHDKAHISAKPHKRKKFRS